MKAVLLAGGLGTRIREETEFRPKPMVEVGGRPILWHIMKNLSQFGITDFIVATGYKSSMIKDYFLNYEAQSNDFTVELGNRDSLVFHGAHDEADWRVTVAFTGDETQTGGRVFRASKYLDDEPFLVTYGDGLANVDIDALRAFHAVSRPARHGDDGAAHEPLRGARRRPRTAQVTQFREKPRLDGWINIGFMILEPASLKHFDRRLRPRAGTARRPRRLRPAGRLPARRASGSRWTPSASRSC